MLLVRDRYCGSIRFLKHDLEALDVPFQRLPETMNITDISDKLLMRYPALRAEGNRELQVKDWLAFAIGEYYRSNKIELLMRTNGDASTLGNYMDQAWIDAGKLYGIRTPQMDLIADIFIITHYL